MSTTITANSQSSANGDVYTTWRIVAAVAATVIICVCLLMFLRCCCCFNLSSKRSTSQRYLAQDNERNIGSHDRFKNGNPSDKHGVKKRNANETYTVDTDI